MPTLYSRAVFADAGQELTGPEQSAGLYTTEIFAVCGRKAAA
jgi:hypothetical protein